MRGEIAKTLRLWGPSKQAVLGAAERLDPKSAAALLDRAIATDRATKRGVGTASRSLEVLAVEIADRMGSRRSARMA